MKLSDLFRHPSLMPLFTQLVLAYEWVNGGWGKLQGETFVTGMTKTLTRFTDGNPHTWYVQTFLEMAKNRPEAFGQLVQWGELLVGVGLVIGVLSYAFSKSLTLKRWTTGLVLFSLFVGAFMNANFYFAAGWTSPSTGGLNLLMFWIEIGLLLFWLNSWLNKPESRKISSR